MTSNLPLTLLDPFVEGAVNLRDLGGLPAGEYRVRRGRVFRSGMMHAISPEGLERLAGQHGIRTIVDLRNQVELDQDGLSDFDAAGIRHIHLPVSASTAATPDAQDVRAARMRAFMEGTRSWSEAYQAIVSYCAPAYVRFFETIAEPDSLAAVFHCSAGRDRTGIAAALLLEVLGVDDEKIVTDYHATGVHLQPHAHRYSRISVELGMTGDEIARLLMTNPAAMTEFLSHMRETHGGAERYLVTNGLDPAVLVEIRGQLLERA